MKLIIDSKPIYDVPNFAKHRFFVPSYQRLITIEEIYFFLFSTRIGKKLLGNKC